MNLEIDDPRWLDLVESDSGSLPFHRPEWARFLSNCYGYSPFVIGLLDEYGQLAAGVPLLEVRTLRGKRRWIGLPFTDACGPVVRQDAGEIEAALVSELDRARIEAGISGVEIRSPLRGAPAVTWEAAVIQRLKLSLDPDENAQRFRPGVRQGIRAAERAGVVVRRARAEQDLTSVFYKLHLRTRRRLGVPVQSRRFFRLLWRGVLTRGGGFVLVASVNERPVAAALFLTAGRTVVYKYGASDDRFWTIRPNNALFSDAIRWASSHGYDTFDFGRSDFEAAGLRRFKSSWGAVETPLIYSSLGEPEPPLGKGQAGAVASTIIRHSPAAVCRAAGLFYRWGA